LSLPEVEIYTGACLGGPDISTFAVILRYGEVEKKFCRYSHNFPLKEAELLSVVEGLSCLKKSCRVRIFTPSAFVLQTLERKLPKWLSSDQFSLHGFFPYQEHWAKLVNLLQTHKVEWISPYPEQRLAQVLRLAQKGFEEGSRIYDFFADSSDTLSEEVQKPSAQESGDSPIREINSLQGSLFAPATNQRNGQ